MDLHEFFRNEVKPAVGCTEPVAVALAASEAARHLGCKAERVTIAVSLNIYKNGRDVGIPGTDGLRGNRVAAALGALYGDADKGLMVLDNVTPDMGAHAREMVDKGMVIVEVMHDVPPIFIRAELTGGGSTTSVEIVNRHDAVHRVVKDGETVFESGAGTESSGEAPAYVDSLMSMSMKQMWELAESIDRELETFLLSGVTMNMDVARAGLEAEWGLGVGHTLADAGTQGDNLLTRIKATAAAAADVRMGGASVTVMSSAGSGNHGITAIIPVAVAGAHLNRTDRQVAEAVALSHLVTGFVKGFTGRLTPLCGCSVAAGAGAAAGLVRILGGTPEQAESAVASLMGSLMGMLCDGAKGSCGLKVSAAAGEAYSAALLAMENRGVQRGEGLVSPNLHTTASALGELCTRAFADTDRIMVDILQRRSEE